MSDEDDQPPPRREQLSKTPSWVMLGFVIGCLCSYAAWSALENPGRSEAETEIASALPVQPTPSPTPVPERLRPSLSDVEAVFVRNLESVVWEHDITEVAMWNIHTHTYADFFEVMRSGGFYYFRPIPHLTRPIIDAVPEENAVLRFTETAAMRAKRLEPIPPFFRPPPPKP